MMEYNPQEAVKVNIFGTFNLAGGGNRISNNRMGYMKSKLKFKTEEEIECIVIAKEDDESAWGLPVKVSKSKSTSLALGERGALCSIGVNRSRSLISQKD